MASHAEEKIKKLERDWQSMIKVSHDFFHAWRKVVAEEVGEERTRELVKSFWENVAEGTAEVYRGAPDDLAKIVSFMARASDVMGETVKTDADDKAHYLIHVGCPWLDSYRENGIPNQCQEGCDRWFEKTLELINPQLKMETTDCLAAGGKGCIRKFTRRF